eukprot:UN20603
MPPEHACQANEMMKHFVKTILCDTKNVQLHQERVPPPKPATPINLPHIELTPPNADWFIQERQNHLP